MIKDVTCSLTRVLCLLFTLKGQVLMTLSVALRLPVEIWVCVVAFIGDRAPGNTRRPLVSCDGRERSLINAIYGHWRGNERRKMTFGIVFNQPKKQRRVICFHRGKESSIILTLFSHQVLSLLRAWLYFMCTRVCVSLIYPAVILKPLDSHSEIIH